MDVRTRAGIGGVGGFSSAKADKVSSNRPSLKSSNPPSLKRTTFVDVFDRLGREHHESPPKAAATAEASSAPASPIRSLLGMRLDAAAEAREQSTRVSGDTLDEVNPARVVVWAMANRVESDGKTKTVPLKRTVQLSGDGVRIEMLHVSGATVIKSVQDHQPFVGDTTVTDDAFDQSQALATASAFFERISGYGIDLRSVYHDPEHHDGIVRILVNGTSEDNAGYAAGANVYVYGTADGKFHLASCKEILVHELGHGYFDHIAPGLNVDETGEGKPFHEAFGDLFAALNFANPNISEDIAAFLASTGGATSKALRVLVNDAKLSTDVHEEHDRSLVYSGMMWSATTALAKSVGMDKACDLMLGAVAKAPFFVTRRSPTPEDVARAFADGIRAHISDTAVAAQALQALSAEAIARNVVTSPAQLEPAAKTATAQAFQASLDRVKEKPLSAKAIAGIARRLAEVQQHGDLGFEVIGDRTAGEVRRVTLRALAPDAATNTNVRVEDGLLELVIVGNSVRAVDGGALLLAPFDLAQRDADAKSAVETARKLTRDHLRQAARKDKGAEAVSRAFDTLFSNENLKAERVISHGKLCISLSTMAGEFIVDVCSGTVCTRRLMHVYTLR